MKTTESIVSYFVDLAMNNMAAFLLGAAVTMYMVYVRHQLDDKLNSIMKILGRLDDALNKRSVK